MYNIKKEEKKNRIIGIDIIKVIACLFVVIIHLYYPGNINISYSSILYYMGVVAIPLFFMTNGYLLFGRTKTNPFYTYKKRDNILLLVLFWNVLLAIAFALFEHKIRNPLPIMIRNLFFQEGVFFQFWYFGALLIIYMLFPILDRQFNDNKSLFIKICLSFIFLQIVVDGLNIFSSIKYNFVFQSLIPQTFRLESHISYFLLGGLVKLHYDKIQKYINWVVVIILFFIVILYQYIMIRNVYPVLFCEFFYDNLFVITLCIAIFICCLKLKYRSGQIISVLSKKLILLIYILHISVMRIIDRFFAIDEKWLVLLVTLTVTSLLSFVITKIPYTEKLWKI
jgi:surface polysaccharide O-acyltransferase-like enzyme